jgi:hypothetical protein
LIPGTLVVLTNDNFNTMKLGVVVSRADELLEDKYDLQLDILFREEDMQFVWDDGYIMVSIAQMFSVFKS